VEATCTRVLVISRGELVANGAVSDLLAAGRGLSTYVVEAAGHGVADSLSRLSGVDSHTVEDLDGRTCVRLSVAGEGELRPEIFRMATEKRWVLWELHREKATLEQIFRELTADTDRSPPDADPQDADSPNADSEARDSGEVSS